MSDIKLCQNMLIENVSDIFCVSKNNSDIKLCQNTSIENMWDKFYVGRSARHIMS